MESEKGLKKIAKDYEYATTKFGKAEIMGSVNIVNAMSENRMDDHMSQLEETILKEINDEKNIPVFKKVKEKFEELFEGKS